MLWIQYYFHQIIIFYPIFISHANNISIIIETNSVLQAQTNISGWPIKSNEPEYINFFEIGDSENIILNGNGLINGNGQIWYPIYNTLSNSRPSLIWFYHCNNITVENMTFLNSPMFHLMLDHTNNVIIHDINITSPNFTIAHNTDGMVTYYINVDYI